MVVTVLQCIMMKMLLVAVMDEHFLAQACGVQAVVVLAVDCWQTT